ncbi:hypothetical protein KIW84_064822 [Lathyrus oleraceus]|uniref:DUF7745 domain-containing protein n=1 Tax=Pisum sativum TaxID=3888 RepID=A0A9D5A8R9_PEA|nr:hypothetical protein KIW84_064822 [Pisum sativum]
MPKSIHIKFTLKYERILDLLRVPVKLEAVTALAQFYDPPLWCFLFQDFLLAPMLEEFGLYLEIPEDRKRPYMGMGKNVKPKELVVTLGIPTEDLLSHHKEDKDIQGLKRSYLEGVTRRMDEEERRGSYVDVLPLIMFGIVLFPNVSDFVDITAINIFWDVNNLEANPVPALLADESPEEDELEEFILHGGETSHKELLRKVTRAWKKVHVKENKLKRKNTSSEESYTHWVKEMVRLIKLPFVINPTYVPNIPDPIPVSLKEVDHLRATIARLEQDKESLEHSLYDATYEKNQISYDLEQKDKQLLESMEELQAKRSKRQKNLGGLFSAKVNFENINGKLKEAQDEIHRWKRSWELAAWEQQERENGVMTQIRGFEGALVKS